MDAKDLRTESAVSERNNDGSKYSQSGGIALHCDRNKSYQDIGSNSLGKVDIPNTRPCAVIGPDRIVPPPAASEAYHFKKGPAELWPCMDNAYRRPPEYPHKLTNFQNPTRNISPRQTFQENMQRIMVPPSYSSIKINDDTNYAQMPDRSNGLSKNIKLNMPPEAKFCDVPYSVNPNNIEQKNVRNPEMCLPSVNPTITRTAPHGWPPGSVNLRSTRMYSAPELYQYQEYPSCAGPRPVVPRPHRTVAEEQGYVYADPYYQEGNIRFKPYPNVKERYPQQRYEYISNYSNPFHPPPGFPSHKYELQKSMPSHPYPPYPPIKYLDNRVAEPVMEGYQRNPQGNYNIQYRNPVIHPNYGQVLGNCPQNKMHSYPPDAQIKNIAPNKLPYDNNTKAYIEYENNRPKIYPPSESYYVSEMARMPMKSQVIMPNYPTLNMHNIQQNPYYKKDSQQIKTYEHNMAHYRNIDANINVHNPMSRHAPVFSPNTLAISPTDSNTSNDTTQTLGTSQEDCGYVSQSSTASVRSIDSAINRIPHEYLRKYYDNRYGPIIRTSSMMSKSQLNSNNNSSKEKKQIDVRQFLQMWNEGDEEAEENGSKQVIIQKGSSDKTNYGKTHESMNSQEQLYVLGLVNVPSEELAKYEHIQKVSKLPENIKGYNSIELLNQFEEVIESSNMNNYKTPREFQMSLKGVMSKQVTGVIPPRPVSPLDVEAKISQSVIHKEVGCNFEIKPCSPKMLNVEVAAPIQNILGERSIEKVANPVMIKSPTLNRMDENIDCNRMKNIDCNRMKRPDHRLNINDNVRIPSCKMINTQFSNGNNIDPIKSSYSLQDLESNSGLCLASLPRLDNDIELNFPEVNQQFINANKGDSTVLTTSIRDLPTLEVLDQLDNQNKDKIDSINSLGPETDINKSPYVVDSEKEFSKLSKYRKTKTYSTEPKENQAQHNVNTIRTDSVIIKNPENIKNYEENLDYSSNSLNKVITDIQQTPINLTSQCNLTNNTDFGPLKLDLHDADKEKQMQIEPVEIAIDFSLNKTSILDSNEREEAKIESRTETPIHIEKNTLKKLMNNDDSSGTGSILPVFSEQNENFINMDNKDDNCSRSRDTDTDCKHEQVAGVDNNDDNKYLKDISPGNESYSETDSEIDKCESDIKSVEEMIIQVSSNPLSATNTEITVNEPLNYINHDNCVKETDRREGTTTDKQSEEANYTFIKTDSEIPQNNKKELQDKNCDADPLENTPNAEVEETCENHSIDKTIDCLGHNEVKLDTDTSEIHNPNQIDNDVVTEQAQTQNIDCNNVLLTNKEMCCNDCDHSDSIESQNILNSDPHPFSNDFMMDEDDINDKTEFNNKTLLLKELPNHERELNVTEKIYCEDIEMNSSVKSDECCIEKSSNEGDKNECENIAKPAQRYLWYGSKELYSPWIQKLLMFTEGNNREITSKNEISCNDDCLLDTTKKYYKSTKNIVNDSNDCFFDTPKIALLEKDYYKNVTEDLKQENANETVKKQEKENATETVKKIIDSSVCETSILNENNGETKNYDHFEIEENSPILNNNIDESANSNNHFEVEETSPILNDSIDEIVNSNSHFEVEERFPIVNDTIDKTVNTNNHLEVKESSPILKYNMNQMVNSNNHFEVEENSPNLNDNIDETVNTNNHLYVEESSPIMNDNIDKIYNSNNHYVEESSPILNDNIDKIVNSNNFEVEESSPILIDDTVKSYNYFEAEDSSKFKANNIDYEEKESLGKVDNIITTGKPEDIDEFNDTDAIDPLESEPNKEKESLGNEDNNITTAGKPEDTDEFKDTDPIDPLESEAMIIENVGSETPIRSPTLNHFNGDIDNQCEEPDTSGLEDGFLESLQEVSKQTDEDAELKNAAPESTAPFDDVRYFSNNIQANVVPYKKRQPLKRSLSDSALNMYNNNNDEPSKQGSEDNVQFIWPFKRRKVDNDSLAQNLRNIIHHTRRNSISTFYNEENVSFCILIDNSCILTEEENEEQENMCYTELSEDCLAEIQSNCVKHNENIETSTEVVSSPQQENACDYSDSFVLECEENKRLEESWVEDIACVETVISDDIAEDIEICEPSSPKNDFSENDESGVFSSSEHTDKVKYIYGDNMCYDDARFVETLYKTPQMDVNKTLYGKEPHASEEYDRYYDNDSLEKMLSESNEQELSPYIPEYMHSMFTSGVLNPKETPENKENVNSETFPPFQSKANAIVVDMNVNKIEHENKHSIEIFTKTRDDTIHSSESSVDNVFTYNRKDEDTIFTTSSSPEVSSTTSEEKNSGILLKITNYKGSRISHINDISRVNKRSSCKFTEDKEYLQSHTNFPTNRPLLTKAAQKYIPPLKESIRDLKVKLSLPQHSLMKLKQLKISKEESKEIKQNATTPRITKKPKPKFEDVLKSIDEIQFKMHKEKTKKTKSSIPKVVIKKNLNGSHYASTSNKDDFNPDLTGRKWQPWVFIENNHFIDKMAIKKKTKAVYSHRKKTYVLAEKFQKYKSASSAKFVISPPISDNPSMGLKYTIRLKHSY